MDDKQRAIQSAYHARQRERGMFQTRPWLPEELREWHQQFVMRAREWKQFGTPFELPPLPKTVKKAPRK